MHELRHFRFWCYKVLPLVYDNSLSYYEVLCRVVKYINDLIDQDKIFGNELESLKAEIDLVNKRLDNLDTVFITNIVEDCLAKMIFVRINNDGYIVYNIPKRWSDLKFNTTGYDIELAIQPEYGHLTLSMEEDE